jgi:hypothetical protein
MPLQMQPSPFPGLGLAPPMAPITVEAGEANSAAQNVRDLTMDRNYTAVDLAEELVKERNLTVVATIQTNRRHVPDEFKYAKGRQVNSTLFGFSGDCMLLSYVPKKGKVILMLSSEHNRPEISSRDDKKPQAILDYNAAKGGVHVVNQMINIYRCKVSTRRWPLVVLRQTIIDVAALNAFVVWIETNANWQHKLYNHRRAAFLKQLASELTRPHAEFRANAVTGLAADILNAISMTLGRPVVDTVTPSRMPQPLPVERCHVCIGKGGGQGYKKKKYNANKVRQECSKCSRKVCKKTLRNFTQMRYLPAGRQR